MSRQYTEGAVVCSICGHPVSMAWNYEKRHRRVYVGDGQYDHASCQRKQSAEWKLPLAERELLQARRRREHRNARLQAQREGAIR